MAAARQGPCATHFLLRLFQVYIHEHLPSIFKAYDIRGIVDETLTEDAAYGVGRALGLLVLSRGKNEAVVGRDGRLSGPRLCGALADGFRDAGVNVVDIGMVATPWCTSPRFCWATVQACRSPAATTHPNTTA